MARAQTQGCLCVSNPRDPRRGRQWSDHRLPDGGGEGLQRQLVRRHQEGQATGGRPSQPRPVPTGPWATCTLRALQGRWGETGRREQKARPGEARSEPEADTEDTLRPRPRDLCPPNAPPGHRRPPSSAGPPWDTAKHTLPTSPSARPRPLGHFPCKAPVPQTPAPI